MRHPRRESARIQVTIPHPLGFVRVSDELPRGHSPRSAHRLLPDAYRQLVVVKLFLGEEQLNLSLR